MEKRSLIRDCTQISVACSSLTTDSPISYCNGIMLNCSCEGTCIEINQQIHKGSILMIKSAGWAGEKIPAEPPNGVRTVALTEVKWSQPADAENEFNYRIGLRYLPFR
jgi:hypothetical protein